MVNQSNSSAYKCYKKLQIVLVAQLIISHSAILYTNVGSKAKKMVVVVPVANLRGIPQDVDTKVSLPTTGTTNPYQYSQLLIGESVNAHEQRLDSNATKWFRVNVIQQKRYRPEYGWHEFPGWIKASQLAVVDNPIAHNIIIKSFIADVLDISGNVLLTLSIGTRLHGILSNDGTVWQINLPDGRQGLVSDKDVFKFEKKIMISTDELRNVIVATALLFLDSFYSWGGRSAQDDSFGSICSVDCSSFINLVYLAHGFEIPRNAQDQFLTTDSVKYGHELRRGDLVFFGNQNCNKNNRESCINHVMMYIGHGLLIEAAMSAGKVRIISFEKRIGKSHEFMKSGDISGDIIVQNDRKLQYYVYFGSYLHGKQLLQKLRNHFLKS